MKHHNLSHSTMISASPSSTHSSSPPRRANLQRKLDFDHEKKINTSIDAVSSVETSSPLSFSSSFSQQQQQQQQMTMRTTTTPSAASSIEAERFIISLLQHADAKYQNSKEERALLKKRAEKFAKFREKREKDRKKNNMPGIVMSPSTALSSPSRHHQNNNNDADNQKLYLDFSPAVIKTLTRMHEQSQSAASSSHLGRSSDRVKQNIGHLLKGIFGEKRLNEFFENVEEFDEAGDDDDDDKNEEVVRDADEEEEDGNHDVVDTQDCDKKQQEKEKEKEVVGASLAFILGLGQEVKDEEEEENRSNISKKNKKNVEQEDDEDEDADAEFLKEINEAKKSIQNIGRNGKASSSASSYSPSVAIIPPIAGIEKTNLDHEEEEEEESSLAATKNITVKNLVENTKISHQLLQQPKRKRTEFKALPDPSILLEMIVAEHTEMREQAEAEEDQRFKKMADGIADGVYEKYDDTSDEDDESESNDENNSQQHHRRNSQHQKLNKKNKNKTNKKEKNMNNNKKDLSSGFIEHFHSKLDWAIRQLFESQRTADQAQAQYNHFVLEAAKRIDTLEKTIDTLREEKIAHEETKEQLERERERSVLMFEQLHQDHDDDDDQNEGIKSIEDRQQQQQNSNFSRRNKIIRIHNDSRTVHFVDATATTSATPTSDELPEVHQSSKNITPNKFRGRLSSLPYSRKHQHHSSSMFLASEQMLRQKQQQQQSQKKKQHSSATDANEENAQKTKEKSDDDQQQTENETENENDLSWNGQTLHRHQQEQQNQNQKPSANAATTTTPPPSSSEQQRNNNNTHNQMYQNNKPNYSEINDKIYSLTLELAQVKEENKNLKNKLEVEVQQQQRKFDNHCQSLISEKEAMRKALDATSEELVVARRIKGSSSDEVQALNQMMMSLREEIAKSFDVLVVEREKNLSDFLIATAPFQTVNSVFKEYFLFSSATSSAADDADTSNNNNNNNNNNNDNNLQQMFLAPLHDLSSKWKQNYQKLFTRDPSDEQIGKLSPYEDTTTTHLMNFGLLTLNQIRALSAEISESVSEASQKQRQVAKLFMQGLKEVKKNIAQRKKEDDHKMNKLQEKLETAQKKIVDLSEENEDLKAEIKYMNDNRRAQKEQQQQQQHRKHENDGEGEEQEPGKPSTKQQQQRKTSKENTNNNNKDPNVLSTNETSAAPLHDENDDESHDEFGKNASGLLGLHRNRRQEQKQDQEQTQEQHEAKSEDGEDPEQQQQQHQTTTIVPSSSSSRRNSATTLTTSSSARSSTSKNKNQRTTTTKQNSSLQQSVGVGSGIACQTPMEFINELVLELGEEYRNFEYQKLVQMRKEKGEEQKNEDEDEKSDEDEDNENKKNATATSVATALSSTTKTKASGRSAKHSSSRPPSSTRTTTTATASKTTTARTTGSTGRRSSTTSGKESTNKHEIETLEKEIQCTEDDLPPPPSSSSMSEKVTSDFEKVYNTLEEIGVEHLYRNFKTLRLGDEMLKFVENEDLVAAGMEVLAHRRAFFSAIGQSPNLAKSVNNTSKNNNQEEEEIDNDPFSKQNDKKKSGTTPLISFPKPAQTQTETTAAEFMKSKYAQTTPELNIPGASSILERTAADQVTRRTSSALSISSSTNAAVGAEKVKETNTSTNSIKSPSESPPRAPQPTTTSTTSSKPQPVPLDPSTLLNTSVMTQNAAEASVTSTTEKPSSASLNNNNNNKLLNTSTTMNNTTAIGRLDSTLRKTTATTKKGSGSGSPTATTTKKQGKGGNKNNKNQNNNNNEDNNNLNASGDYGVSQVEYEGLQRKLDNLDATYKDAVTKIKQLEAEGNQNISKLKMSSDQLRSTTEKLLDAQKSRDMEQLAAKEFQLDLENSKEKIVNLEKKLMSAEEKRMQESLRAVEDMKRVQEQLEAALHSDVVDKLKAKEKLFLGGSQAMLQALKTLNNSLCCPNCMETIREACVHVPCGHVLCRECVTEFHEEDVGCTIRLDPITNMFAVSGVSYNAKHLQKMSSGGSASNFFSTSKRFDNGGNNNSNTSSGTKHVVAVLPSREYLLPPPAGSGDRTTPIKGQPVFIEPSISENENSNNNLSPTSRSSTATTNFSPRSQHANNTNSTPRKSTDASSTPLNQVKDASLSSVSLAAAATKTENIEKLKLCCAECDRNGGFETAGGLSGVFGTSSGNMNKNGNNSSVRVGGSTSISLTGFVTDIPPTQIVRFSMMDALVGCVEFAMKTAEQARRTVIKNMMVVEAREEGQEEDDILADEEKMKKIERGADRHVQELEESATKVTVKPVSGSRVHESALRGRLIPEPEGVDLSLDEENNNNHKNNKNSNENDKQKQSTRTGKKKGNVFAEAADGWV